MSHTAEGVLLLNATYEPLHILSSKRVLRLLTAGKVEVVEESDREVRSVSVVIRIPSVVRLLRYGATGSRFRSSRGRTSTRGTTSGARTAARSTRPGR
jgi:hypothetical protein